MAVWLPQDSFVLKKGSPARNFYILLSGMAQVLDDRGVCLSRLSKSDVFGEMSLISGDPVGATIKVQESATIVVIEGADFRKILKKFPSVQMYLAKILSKRLADSNVQRADEIASGMSGNLSQMPVAELLQALDLSQKTGTSSLSFSGGSARLPIKSGKLIEATYCDMTGKDAVFAILKESEGRFKFSPDFPKDQWEVPELGSLMEILLDTSRMIDEEICV
jgi:CRP-like cAMP-binding protein